MDFNEIVELATDSAAEEFSDVDESCKPLDRIDKKELIFLTLRFLLLLASILILKSLLGVDRLRLPLLKESFGQLSFLLIWRTLLIDLVIIPFFSFSISSFSTTYMQRKLSNGEVLTRSKVNIGHDYQFYPYAIVSEPQNKGISSIFGRNHAMFKTYSNENVQEILTELEQSLKTYNYKKISISKVPLLFKEYGFVGMRVVASMKEYNQRFDDLEAALNSENEKAKNLNELIDSYKANIQISEQHNESMNILELVQKDIHASKDDVKLAFLKTLIDQGTTNEKLIEKIKSTEKFQSYTIETFCKRIDEDEKFRITDQKSTVNGTSRFMYLLTGKRKQKKDTYGRIFNRVRRSAGYILLNERNAARETGTKHRFSILCIGILISVLGITLKSAVEGSISESGTVPTIKKYNQSIPIRGDGSWDCTGISQGKMDLYKISVASGECLWNDGVAEEVSLSISESTSIISLDSDSQWKAEDDFVCYEQPVSTSMIREGLADGGFLQICGKFGTVLLLQDKLINSSDEYPIGTTREVKSTAYSSDWISVDVIKEISERVGVRKIASIEYVIFDTIREFGVVSDFIVARAIENVIIENRVVTNRWVFGTALGLVSLAFIIAILRKHYNKDASGKLNIRSDDESMLSTFYACLMDLPTCNIVVPLLTPEIKIGDSKQGTKSIDVITRTTENNSLRKIEEALSDGADIDEVVEKYRNMTNPFKKFRASQKNLNSYKYISWEEIQTGHTGGSRFFCKNSEKSSGELCEEGDSKKSN